MAFAQAPLQSPLPIKVLLNWHHQYEYAGFYAAQKLGLYQAAGLDVEIHAWNGQSIVDQVVNGDYQIGVDSTLLLRDFVNGKPIKLLFPSLQYSPNVLIGHKPIASLRELAGKKIMLANNYEILALLHKAGIRLNEIEALAHSTQLKDFIDQRVDFYSAYSTNEPIQLNELGQTYSVIDPKSHGINAYGDLVFTSQAFAEQAPNQLLAFKQATLDGWRYALQNPQIIIDYLLSEFTVNKSRSALLAEANLLGEFVQSGSVPIGHLSSERLRSLVHDMHALGILNQTQLAAFVPEKMIFHPYPIHLTQEEQAFLRDHPVIRIGNDIDWAPFEFIDESSHYRGIAADYLAQIEKMLGIRFQPVTDLSWAQVVEKMQKGELDLYSCAVPNAERQRYAHFTEPYLSFPMVALGQSSLNYLPDIRQLKQHPIAVVKGYASHDYLRKHYPELQLILVENTEQGIAAVQSGKALIYIGNLAAINDKLKKLGDFNLKVVGQIGPRFELAMGAALDKPLLKTILQKALDAIPSSEKNRIYNDWLQLRMVQEYDYRRLILPLSLLSALFLFIAILAGVQRHYQTKLNRYLATINELNYASITDANQRLIWVSDSLCQLTGFDRKELLNQPHKILMHKNCYESHFDPQAIWQQLEQGKTWRGELHGQKKNGDDLWVLATAVPEMNSRGKLKQVRTTRQDMTAQKYLEKLAIKDELTGLYNRRYFNKVFSESLHNAQKIQDGLVLVMLDLDHFKRLNDRYGHYYGDQALRQVGEQLRKTLREYPQSFGFRIGGEEFAIILPAPPLNLLSHTLENLRLQIADLRLQNPSEAAENLRLSVSIGAYVIPKNLAETSEHQIYTQADQALYQAKAKGRNRVEIIES